MNAMQQHRLVIACPRGVCICRLFWIPHYKYLALASTAVHVYSCMLASRAYPYKIIYR